MQLTTTRLLIRKAQEEDAPFFLRLLNEPLYIQMIRDSGVRDLPGAREYIRNVYLKSYQQNGFGLYLVEMGSDPVGIAGFIKRPGLDLPDLGFAMLKEHAGKGYTQEAGQALLRYGQESLGISPVAAITTVDNQASQHVLLKLGFRYQKQIQLPGSEIDFRYYEFNGKSLG